MGREPGKGPLRLAGRIADGLPVDWESAGKDPLIAEHSEGFRILEAVASVHRKASEEAAPTPPTPDARVVSISQQGTKSPPPGGDEPPVNGGIPSEQAHPGKWGHLEIRSHLGRGGSGEVYRAYDARLDKEYALKLLLPERAGNPVETRRFLAEAQRHAKISQTGVGLVPIYGAYIHGDRPGLWMDLVKGETLEQALRKRGRYGEKESIQIGVGICGALAGVHAAGLVHRDVKTANIMRRDGGEVVLMDFSASSEIVEPGSPRAACTPTGTPLYMAPELFRGEAPTPSSDVYSLGVVLYRLVSGQYPVEAATLQDLQRKHRMRESTPIRDARPDLSSGFVRIIERSLHPDPGQRFGTAGEFERALQELVVGRKRDWVWKLISAAALVLLASVLARPVIDYFTPQPPVANLYKLERGTERVLPEGGTVFPGDMLFLQISGKDEMHVYVLSRAAAGPTRVIFPSDRFDTQNPLQAGVSHRLPGPVDGRENFWVMNRGEGPETFIVVAALEPLLILEEKLSSLPAMRPPASPRPGEQDSEPGARVGGGASGIASEGSVSLSRGMREVDTYGLAPDVPIHSEDPNETVREVLVLINRLVDERLAWRQDIHLEKPQE